MRNDEQLAAYQPPMGKTWQDGGFESLAEFQRWSELTRERYNRTRANAPKYFLSADGSRMLSA